MACEYYKLLLYKSQVLESGFIESQWNFRIWSLRAIHLGISATENRSSRMNSEGGFLTGHVLFVYSVFFFLWKYWRALTALEEFLRWIFLACPAARISSKSSL